MANYSVPPPFATLAGDYLTISRFLNTPTVVSRTFNTVAQAMFITDSILTGRVTASGGAALIQTAEGIYADYASQPIAPGAEYPRTTVSTGPAVLVPVVKRGEDTLITDEDVRRSSWDPVTRAMTKLTNTIVRDVDADSLAVVAAAVPAYNVSNTWASATGTPINDLLKAKAVIYGQQKGYTPDTLVLSPLGVANMFGNTQVINSTSRESDSNIAYAGAQGRLAGLDVVESNYLPVGVSGILLDRKVLGGFVDEVPLTSMTYRVEERDAWAMKAQRTCRAYVQEPQAGLLLTGI